MTHEDAGNYKAKHDAERQPDKKIAADIKSRIEDNKITCPDAFAVSSNNAADPEEIGFTIDVLECKISRCQLGLFGHYPEKKLVKPAESVSPELEKLILEYSENNKISCKNTWEIAESLGIKKIDVSAACDKMNIKISNCQLGAF